MFKQSSYTRIPDWLYELLPYVYAVSGISVIVFIPNDWGLFSGLMFISAALAVFFMRRAYRKARRRAQASEERVIQLETERTQLGQFKLIWRDVYLCGNHVIDEQHQQLFETCNSLLTAIENDQPKVEVEFLLETLLTDLSHHSKIEQQILAKTGIPMSPEHRQMHSKLLARGEELLERYRRGTLEMGDLYGFIAYDIAATHVAREATMFVDPI